MPHDHPVGPIRRCRQGGEGEARAVRGEDALGLRQAVEVAEDLDLEVQLLRDAFDDEVGIGDRAFEVGREREAREGRVGLERRR